MRRYVDPDVEYDDMRQRLHDAETFPEVTFIEESHEYFVNGTRFPSVTEVLKPIQTIGGSEETREHKRQIGKAVDKAIELYELDDLDADSLDPECVPFFEGWLAFKRDTGFQALSTQPIVWSLKLRCAGKPDVLGNRAAESGRNLFPIDELIDVKCVWKIDAATAIQTAGYTLLGAESHGWKIKRRGSVQLLRDATYRYHGYTDRNDTNIFLACLSLWSWRQLHAK